MNVSPPAISKVSRIGDDVSVQIPSVPGLNYQTQLASSLQPPASTDSGPAQPGIGGVLTFTDPGAVTNAPSRFYRVRVQ